MNTGFLIYRRAFRMPERIALVLGLVFTATSLIFSKLGMDIFDRMVEMSHPMGAKCLGILIFLRFLDHVTGVLGARRLHKIDPIKFKPVTSRTFIEMSVIKVAQYSVFIILGYWAQSGFGVGYGLLYAFTASIFSESLSIVENLDKLDFAPAKTVLRMMRSWMDWVGKKFRPGK